MSDTQNTYHFVIDALTPESVPMARLAEYMADLANLFGYKEHVHFDRVARGSLVLVQHVDSDHHDPIRARLDAARVGNFVPDDAAKAIESINKRLAQDHATGRLSDHSRAEVIVFPVRDRPRPRTFGPFEEACSFDGMLIRVGGTDDSVPVHLQAGSKFHICNADRDMARRLAPHLYQGTLRVWGEGQWERDASGKWKVSPFNIRDFVLLDDTPLDKVVERLRDVKGSGWKRFDDPLAEIMRLRRDSLDD